MLANAAGSALQNGNSVPHVPLVLVLLLLFAAFFRTAKGAAFVAAPLAGKTLGAGMLLLGVRFRLRDIDHPFIVRELLKGHYSLRCHNASLGALYSHSQGEGVDRHS